MWFLWLQGRGLQIRSEGLHCYTLMSTSQTQELWGSPGSGPEAQKLGHGCYSKFINTSAARPGSILEAHTVKITADQIQQQNAWKPIQCCNIGIAGSVFVLKTVPSVGNDPDLWGSGCSGFVTKCPKTKTLTSFMKFIGCQVTMYSGRDSFLQWFKILQYMSSLLHNIS